MKRVLLLLIITLLTNYCASPRSDLEVILRLENRRVDCDTLLSYLGHSDAKVRARAAAAIGKLEDRACQKALLPLLQDPKEDVRVAATFGLGQLGNAEVESPLIQRLSGEESVEVQERILEALGKIGTEETFLALIKFFNSDRQKLREITALASADMAMRGIINATMTKALTLLLQDKQAEVRWKAAYALMRIREGLDLPALRAATYDKDERVRMQAVTALGHVQDVAALERFATLMRSDPDWRVRVRTASALGSYPLSKAANYLTLLDQENQQVRIAILQAIGSSAEGQETFRQNSREHNLAKYELEQLLIQHEAGESNGDLVSTRPKRPEWSDAEIGAALLSYAMLLREEAVELIAFFEDHESDQVRAHCFRALGETRSTKVLATLQQNYENAPSLVKIAILDAYARVGYFANPKLLLGALEEEDHVLVALAANGLAQDSLKGASYTSQIIAAYERLPQPVDPESAQMIFRALGKIGDPKALPLLRAAMSQTNRALSGVAAEAAHEIDSDAAIKLADFTKPHTDFNYNELAALRGARALIKTNKGNIEFALFAEEAPLTVWNFVQLAEKGFYDRLTFHRVVPNFVIQGGDPRGDSWGSPGYAIRSEFNWHPYIRGTVGMASAGKDTEGCQFFITHSPQPHLTAKYTAFGQVTSGMDVVDAIQAGDVMKLVMVRR